MWGGIIPIPEPSIKKSEIIDMIYPVGSIYLSITAVNPQTLFGGTWERIADGRTLIGSGRYSVGSVGGEETHTLDITNLPDRTMVSLQTTTAISTPNSGGAWSNFERNGWGDSSLYDFSNKGLDISFGQPTSNMQPYLVVDIWERIS